MTESTLSPDLLARIARAVPLLAGASREGAWRILQVAVAPVPQELKFTFHQELFRALEAHLKERAE